MTAGRPHVLVGIMSLCTATLLLFTACDSDPEDNGGQEPAEEETADEPAPDGGGAPAPTYAGTWSGTAAMVYLGSANTARVTIVVSADGSATLQYGPSDQWFSGGSANLSGTTISWPSGFQETTFASTSAGTHTWSGGSIQGGWVTIPISK